MPRIRILKGGYGLPEHGRIILKTSESGPFDVTKNQADRLIQRGIAELVGPEITEQPETDGATVGAGPYEGLTKKELAALLDGRGLAYGSRDTASTLIALLTDADESDAPDDAPDADDDSESETGEAAPELTTADPVQ